MFDTSHRDGSWSTELLQPIRIPGTKKRIRKVRISAFKLRDTIDWSNGKFRSTLDLLANKTGIPEDLLLEMSYPDVDRVMLAFGLMAPAAIRNTIEKNMVPMATPPAPAVAPDAAPTDTPPPNDAIDPRFPAAVGPVQRINEKAGVRAVAPVDDDDGIGMATGSKT